MSSTGTCCRLRAVAEQRPCRAFSEGRGPNLCDPGRSEHAVHIPAPAGMRTGDEPKATFLATRRERSLGPRPRPRPRPPERGCRARAAPPGGAGGCRRAPPPPIPVHRPSSAPGSLPLPGAILGLQRAVCCFQLSRCSTALFLFFIICCQSNQVKTSGSPEP